MWNLDILVEIAIVIASAFAGAYSAFFFERWQKKKTERKEQHAALLEAQFILLQQIGELRDLRTQFLDKFINHPNKWIALPPSHIFGQSINVDFTKLLFILQTKIPDAVNLVYHGQRKYNTLKEVVNERNRLHFRVQERLMEYEKGHKHKEADESHDSIEQILGKDRVAQLMDLTEFIFSAYEETDKALETSLRSLERLQLSEFPRHKILMYDQLKQGQKIGGGQ